MKVTLPENTSEITLNQFLKLRKFLNENENEDLIEREIISIFTEIPRTDFDNIVKKDKDKIISFVNEALNKEVPFKQIFKLNGIEYGFIPNLDNITGGEFLDISNYEKSEDDLNYLMAVLFREVTNKDGFSNYKIKKYKGTEDRAELFLNMPMNVVKGALGFFLNLSEDLRYNILKSIKVEAQKEIVQ